MNKNIKKRSLLLGIGNNSQIKRYYDAWANDYDQNLREWNYKAPKESSLVIKKYTSIYPKKILDLACGTGFFAQEILKIYPKSRIDGVDISANILLQAKKKNIYGKLTCLDFDKIDELNIKYSLISCIGAMTYVKNQKELFLNIHDLLSRNGFFIFTHRVDLWQKENFPILLENLSNKFKSIYISMPRLYLPKNKSFVDKIRIRIVLLQKIQS